jgi:hypothetical protein
MTIDDLKRLVLQFDEHGSYELSLPDVLEIVSGGDNGICQNTACVRINTVCEDGEIPGVPSVNVPDVLDLNCSFPDMMCAMCSC